MTATQHPPLMPSGLVSHHESSFGPSLPKLLDFGRGFESHRRSMFDGQDIQARSGSKGINTLHESSKDTAARPQYNMNVHGGSWRKNGAPVIPSNAHPYPTPRASDGLHSRQSSQSQIFMNTYHPAKQQHSPPTTSEQNSSRQQEAPRRPSSSSNAIAKHLQIPASINDSKGSLPEFAAQITCLFWFEASTTLLAVEESRTPSPRPIVPLVSEAMPSTGFRKWVTTILSMTQVSQNVILLALMFIYRLKKHNPSVKGKVGSEFRLLTVALMLGNKFLDDNTYTNKTWADVSGISVQEIHVMEVEFLSNMRYSLYASGDEWDEWHIKLGKFADYFDKATRIDAVENILPAPRLAGPATLPSPISQQASPSYIPQISPTNTNFPHPLSMPPYMPSMATSSAASTPGSDSVSRKRSLEDSNMELPPKRTMSSIPSMSSSTTLTPTTSMPSVPSSTTLAPISKDYSSTWRLPPPQPSGHTHTPPPQSLPQLPAGRSMASVFPSHGKSFQRAQLPSLHPTYMPNPQTCMSSAEYQQLTRMAPYSQASQTPSPTSYHFPHHQTPTGLSPSGFPAPRTSPYKPIRGVNTLLVPPPISSVQQAPAHLSYDQMHYQPLGGPRNERRTGQLPFHNFYTWSDNAHQMQPQLPPPMFSS